jgi:hypothetical protein
MAEVTVKSIQELAPNLAGAQTRLVYVAGTSAANNDTITVSDLTTVKGAFLISTTGTAATMTFSTNVITVTNGSTLVWSGLAWGT